MGGGLRTAVKFCVDSHGIVHIVCTAYVYRFKNLKSKLHEIYSK